MDEIVLRTELLGEQELRVGGQSRVLSVRATDGAGQFLDDFSAVIPV